MPLREYILNHCVLLRKSVGLIQNNKLKSIIRPTSTWKTYIERNYSTKFNQPTGGNDLIRAGGIASMFRLPIQKDSAGLDACFVGVPIDIGCSNRSGTRLGPRQIRTESVLVRPYNYATGAAPFESMQVADIGDVNFNTYNLPEGVKDISGRFKEIVQTGCIPLTLGGDHTITYPILQAIKERHGPVGLVHVDAHNDTSDSMLGAKITHGTPFRRAVDEGLLDCTRVIQLGLRGSAYSPDTNSYSKEQGFRVVIADDCWHKSLLPLMEEVREQMGTGPVYISFDIDAIDPGFAPGTGTPEIGGLTPIQALEVIRGCRGLNIVGADMVEVCPAYDQAGTTALLAANLMFEILCVLPQVKFYPR